MDNIPSKGFVKLERGDFYDPAGTALSSQDATIRKVELQSGDRLYNVQGPIFQ